MADDDTPQDTAPPAQQQPGGGRTLGGAYVPPEASSSSSTPQPTSGPKPAQRGLRTLKDLQSAGASGSGGHGHDHDDDDEDDDRDQDFFAGGEKSGLAVQNPGQGNAQDHISNILKRAREYVKRSAPRYALADLS